MSIKACIIIILKFKQSDMRNNNIFIQYSLRKKRRLNAFIINSEVKTFWSRKINLR